jgi:hypothetical protein
MVLPYLKVSSLYFIGIVHRECGCILDVQAFVYKVLWWIVSYIFEILLKVVSDIIIGHKVGNFLSTKWEIFFLFVGF